MPPGGANTGDELMTLLASALAGGNCIDCALVLRADGTEHRLGCTVKTPSTRAFLCSFRWGQVRHQERVSGPAGCDLVCWDLTGLYPLTIDLDSTVHRTYGPPRGKAQRRNHAGVRACHPPFAVAAGQARPGGSGMEGQSQHGAGCCPLPRVRVGQVLYNGATG